MDIKHFACAMQVKALDGDGVFAGYASVFGELDKQNEIVAPGAFTRTLRQWRQQGRAPAMLWMHDPTQPIGLWLSLNEDNNGLAVQGRLALRTQKGGDAYELLKLGALTGLSIGYRVITSRVDAERKARVLTDVDLFEISLVTFPANEAARVGTVKSPEPKHRRSVTEDRQQLREAAQRLKRAARKLVE
ncbi:MAG: HK97 family phage prohead protease [Alphaproteobacteria bacterium]|nr:HK97 family phage prohead protease [Alphaproteobacteria bacterium]MBV8548706.1 HK97 family phage prohead protease [Alphaproteobacteria bacterium]